MPALMATLTLGTHTMAQIASPRPGAAGGAIFDALVVFPGGDTASLGADLGPQRR